MHAWRRYPKLLGVFWRSAFSVELEYRVNFISNALLSVFWMIWAALGASVFYQFSDSINGWSYGELLVVIGLFFAINGIRQAVFDPNLDRMTDYIRNGTLDFLLTKPINTQFMVSFRYLGVYNLFDPLLGLSLSTLGLRLAHRTLSLPAVAAFAVMLTTGILLLYTLTVLLMALAIRLVNADELGQVSFAAVELARFPVQLYRNPVRTILTIVPIAFFTTYPAQALLGRLAPRWLYIGPAISITAVLAASTIWKRSLRTYSGASS